ncbi:NCK-interacting protein with SH3 domain [Galendromus occidentalis]|uniref:NCK-interacting protein with SH3 domain n=1 Tax=Galendromus occidentalis TaxID=34638 RepID=A0AAJ7SFX6_9ACAR|nr:NCK-interacting protein with SH3 domain [Galendromus occidentalis]
MASTVCQALALYEYEAKDDRLLNLRQDQSLIVIEKLSRDPNWLYAITADGLTGFVPSNYVFKSTELDTQLADRTLSALQKTSETHNEFQKKAVRCLREKMALSRLNSDWLSENLWDPQQVAREMVDQVQAATKLSPQMSKTVVRIVLDKVAETMPSTLQSNLWRALMSKIETLSTTSDFERLTEVFKGLYLTKNDEQQRSWPLHQDENTINTMLEQLYSMLVEIDSKTCARVLASENYEYITTLVAYYQMETRHSLRVWMLRVFLTCCELDYCVVSVLLHSILPMELARDLQTQPDLERFKYSLLLLTVIFCTGEKPPNDVYGQVNETFIDFLLERIEKPVDDDQELAELCVGVLLAISLTASDFVMEKLLKTEQPLQCLTQKLLLLINREDDPTKILNHTELSARPTNSVMNMLICLFSEHKTADLFYLNDLHVLIDIIARQLADTQPTDERRADYLQLIENIINQGCYQGHRFTQLEKCFTEILNCSESLDSHVKLVRRIQESGKFKPS